MQLISIILPPFQSTHVSHHFRAQILIILQQHLRYDLVDTEWIGGAKSSYPNMDGTAGAVSNLNSRLSVKLIGGHGREVVTEERKFCCHTRRVEQIELLIRRV